MKSRRRIAFPKGTNIGPQCKRSDQENPPSEMGFNGQFALRKF